MIIRILLLSGLAAIGYLVFLRRSRLQHIVLVFGILTLAAGAVLFPELTNDVAHFVGVGRGADLITYLVQVGLLFIVLHYYTKFVDLQRQITHLVREIALLRGERDQAASETPKEE
jgi:hypothetical protein